jgi:hypothetical protein
LGVIRCVERVFSRLHSLKDFEEWNEAASRAYFQEGRPAPVIA